jgi:hypothetical protein
MNLIMNNLIQERGLSTMEYVRLKILANFFRGDVLGQAARVKDTKSTDAMRILADEISGADLQAEDARRRMQ